MSADEAGDVRSEGVEVFVEGGGVVRGCGGGGGGRWGDEDLVTGQEGGVEAEMPCGVECGLERGTKLFGREPEAGAREEERVERLAQGRRQAGPRHGSGRGGGVVAGALRGADADALCERLHWRGDEPGRFEDGDVPVRLRVHALRVEAKVRGQCVQEGSLVRRRGPEAQPPRVRVGGEGAEVALVRRRPA